MSDRAGQLVPAKGHQNFTQKAQGRKIACEQPRMRAAITLGLELSVPARHVLRVSRTGFHKLDSGEITV